MLTPAEKRTTFRELHGSGCFVIPNPWDVGSAKYLAQLGFKALASTSSGFAWSRGRPDNGITLAMAVGHFEEIAGAVDIPVNADFEGAFAVEPRDIVPNIQAAVRSGIAGISIEDSTGDPNDPLYHFDLARDRVAAAVEAAGNSGVMVTARSEGFIVGRPDLDETIRRLIAYSQVGADCLYAPGLKTREQIAAIVNAVAPKPVNVLVTSGFTNLAELAGLRVRRISVGGALARTAWTGFMTAAKEIAEGGTFNGLGTAVTGTVLNGLFEDEGEKVR